MSKKRNKCGERRSLVEKRQQSHEKNSTLEKAKK